MKKQIGSLLIISSIFLFAYIYYPILTAYFPTSNQILATSNQPTISIPKINATAAIIEDVDPGNQVEYKKALQQGVAQAKGFAKPGQKGLVYLFAHSSLPPWEMTRSNTVFLRLNELQNGDQVLISQDGKQFKYEVINKQAFWPGQTEVFNQEKGKDELILQTCTPIGTDLKRLLVFAKPI